MMRSFQALSTIGIKPFCRLHGYTSSSLLLNIQLLQQQRQQIASQARSSILCAAAVDPQCQTALNNGTDPKAREVLQFW